MSERYQRKSEGYEVDEKFRLRLIKLLDHPRIDKFSLVDAYYYDYSAIPQCILDKYNFYRDMYLIYGITDQCDIVSKWIERWDLDSDDPIIDGEVKRN
jgi:hypothetical protein